MIKWIGLGLAGVVFVAILYFVGVLLAAHYQIRQVDPDLPSREALIEATNVPDRPIRVRYINTASQPIAAEQTLGHPAFLLEWRDGRRLLIDTGMERDEAIAFGKPLEFLMGAEPTTPHGSIREQLGDDFHSIDAIAFTHLHSDHTNGIVALCENRAEKLPVFQTPWQRDQGNHTTEWGADDLLEAVCAAPTRLSRGPIYAIPGFPGLVAVAAGGHTPGSTLFFANVAGHVWIFSGDITNTREELVRNLPKAALYSLLIIPESPRRLEVLRTWLAGWDRDPGHTVVVSHDQEALEKAGILRWTNLASSRGVE